MFARRVLVLLVACAALTVPASASAATTIDTTGSWDGIDNIFPWGYPDTATYGQLVTAPATDTVLDSFSFYAKELAYYGSGTDFTYRAYVYAWDGSKATGSALWHDATAQLVTLPAGGDYQELKAETGGVSLVAGQQYVLFLSVSEDYGTYTTGTNAQFAWVPGSTYAGGNFVHDNNGGDTSEWTDVGWDNPGTFFGGYFDKDLSFKAAFSAPAATNADPALDTAAADADGAEGDTLSAAGKFTDANLGDTLTLSADNTEGTFTDNGDGTWDWELATTDDVASDTITVTADDGNGGTASDEFEYSAANANPVLSPLNLSAGGTSSCNPTLGFGFTDAGSGDTHSGAIDWGDSSTDDTFTTSPVSKGHAYLSAGTYTIEVDLSDDDLGTDSDSVQRTVYNVPSNLLDPMNADGSSRFKRGSTIPLKLRVLDCARRPVAGLVIQVALKQINESGGNVLPVNEVVSNVAGDAGNKMRESSGYIFNLSSKRSQFNAGQDLVVGKYRLTLTSPTFPGSGHAVTQDFRLVK